jgi:hypothetical protein
MTHDAPVPGEGVEPSRPTKGHLILSQARMTSFATPADRTIALSVVPYRPASNAYFCGIFAGGLPKTSAISWCDFSSRFAGLPT